MAVKKEKAAVGGPTQEQIEKRLEEVEDVGAEVKPEGEKAEKADADNQEAAAEKPDKEEEKKMGEGLVEKEPEDAARLPSQILEQMRTSNIKGIIHNMTIHE